MKIKKSTYAKLIISSIMLYSLVACGNKESVKDTSADTYKEDATTETTVDIKDAGGKDATDDTAEKSTDVTDENTEISTDATNDTIEKDTDADDTSTITIDEAIELVKQEVGEDFTFVPADELEEKDGSQYYVIYVEELLDSGNLTTLTTYLVKTDGSEFFDKYVTSIYVGEYVYSGEIGETVFKVFEDGTFEITATGEVNQVVSGSYKFGITESANIIKLMLYPKKSIVDYNGEIKEEDMTGIEGTAMIEDGKLTLRMESEDTVFIKK